MTTRPQFEFPHHSFTAIDLALALGKTRDWAISIVGRMEKAAIVRKTDDGKYRFTLRKKYE